jgi:Holliday junction resolvase RusA-like endonuclease
MAAAAHRDPTEGADLMTRTLPMPRGLRLEPVAPPASTVSRITFRVYGIPKTQGSMRAVIQKGTGRAIAFHSSDAELRSWRTLIVDAARTAFRGRGLLDGAVQLRATFWLPVPASRPTFLRTDKQRTQWTHPWRKPDLDKLLRAVLDSLTGVLIKDDAQLVRIVVDKRYGPEPGAQLTLEVL